MESRAEADPTRRRALVLVVDDEEAMLEVYQDTLQRLGVQVVAERDPRRCVEAFQRNGAYDLVLLDLRMPHLDGLTLLQHIRAGHPHLPVIVITGYPSRESAERCRQLGVLHYMRKPFDPEDLLRRVRAVITHDGRSGP
ncbi:MAG: response regulator [Planctomycetes bacterium]|nr:response regulator [Planctomycetota bacterium]